MKMIGLHTLSHVGDSKHAIHCTICDHAVAHNLTPAHTPIIHFYSFENFELNVQKEVFKNYCFFILKSISKHLLFSRPPPCVI